MRVKNINVYLFVLILIIALMMYSCNVETYNVGSALSGAPVPKRNEYDGDAKKYFATASQKEGFQGPSSKIHPKTHPNEILSYNYPSIYDDPYRYPNVTLPPQVIGCGGRRGGCMGGSQIPIPNTLPPVNISPENIAPVNLTVRGFDEGIQQVGTIQKVFGSENMVYPLFGRKRYRNDNQWEYFVKFGKYGVILPIVALRNYEELNTNDEVHIQGQKDKYRTTMYDEDIPQYLPYT